MVRRKGLFYRAAGDASEVLTLKRVIHHSLSKHGCTVNEHIVFQYNERIIQ
jgi:hypothetical protein